MLLLGTRLARDRHDSPAARVGTLLMACLSVQVFNSLPLLENAGPWWWQAPLVGVSVGNSVLFWVFARSLFDDAFEPRPLHAAAWLGVVALGTLFYAVVVMPQQRELAPFPLAVAIAMRWTPLVFAALAVAAAASQWRAPTWSSVGAGCACSSSRWGRPGATAGSRRAFTASACCRPAHHAASTWPICPPPATARSCRRCRRA
jgi:hypothetical protein